MRVRIVKSVVVGGHPGVRVGDVIEVSGIQASEIIGSGDGVELKGEPATIETRDPEVENRDLTPKKARKTQP